jgi:hypothetical protein
MLRSADSNNKVGLNIGRQQPSVIPGDASEPEIEPRVRA